MKENDEKLREMLTSEEIPEQLSPENIKKMLDEKAPKKKRTGITMVGRLVAGAAACAVVAGSYAGTAYMMKARKNNSSKTSSVSTKNGKNEIYVKAPYMNGADSYEDVYKLMASSAKRYEKELKKKNSFITGGLFGTNTYKSEDSSEVAIMEEGASNDYSVREKEESGDFYNSENEGVLEFSDTYNQEEGVREADIVKTDGKNIYYLWNNYIESYDESQYSYKNVSYLDIASVKDGEFVDSKKIDLTPDISALGIDGNCNVQVYDMYVYNDMIEVIGTIRSPYSYTKGYYENDYHVYGEGSYQQPLVNTFVSVYTNGENPELIGTYFQDGIYNDVRIAPDGCMYLISNHTTVDFESVENSKNIERYIPCCGTDGNIECLIPDDILMPIATPAAQVNLDYTIISGIDFSESGTFKVVDTKALAGFTGSIYSSADNIYLTEYYNSDTNITRIAVNGGLIEPEASGTVEGMVLNQFSMSEYNGYFRIATTINKYHDNSSFIGGIFGTDSPSYMERNNAVTVLDLDLNIVGMIKDFGINESIKSVNFSGNMGYVVTYLQTDPLFAIDLSEPANPTIVDEFKINGFSTYMQKWNDGLLLGFGIDADESGIQTGVKLVMFDNSDPNDLKEVGFYAFNNDYISEYFSSRAIYDHKAILIAPEKNLIGFPLQIYNYNENLECYSYVFFSYENGQFVQRGDIGYNNVNIQYLPDRAVYIGDYVYVLSGGRFTSADIETMTVRDTVEFD